MSQKTPRLTPAQRRVLLKAVRGPVRITGGYGGPVSPAECMPAGFDRGRVIDRLVARKLLKPGEYTNTYVLTDEGSRRARNMTLPGARLAMRNLQVPA